MTDLHHIIYMSVCTHFLSDSDLANLLSQARSANEANKITGMLVYNNKNVFQIIEGDEETLAALYVKLGNDKRHRNLVKIADKPIKRRSFSEWSMAYKALNDDEYHHLLAGYLVPDAVQFNQANMAEVDTMLLNTLKSFLFPEV